MRFGKLLSVDCRHDYFQGLMPDLEFVPLMTSAKTLASKKLRVLSRSGTLSIYAEQNDSNQAKAELENTHLWFSVFAKGSTFATITKTGSHNNNIDIYDNVDGGQVTNTLTKTTAEKVEYARYTHHIQIAQRPLTLSLQTSESNTIKEIELNEDSFSSQASETFLLQQHDQGVYQIKEQSQDDTNSQNIAYFPNIHPFTICLLKLTLEDAMLTAPPSYEINFEAVDDTLNYYICTSNYNNTDLSALSVVDGGFNEQNRSEINFTRTEADDFGSSQINKDLLTSNNKDVLLFSSQNEVSRREQGPKKLQLKLNNEILITSLPTPGSNSVSADFFIHVAKP